MAEHVNTVPPAGGSIAARIVAVLVGASIMALLASLFALLDSAFIFSGPLLPYVRTSFQVFLFGVTIIIAVTCVASGFRGVYAVMQDEAVVILAVIASAIVVESGDIVNDSVYVTVLAAIAISTVFTGFVFYALGALKLGRIIRYVPFSVTAGFMITIGWLLISGGFKVATGLPVDLDSLPALLSVDTLPFWAAAVIFAIVLELVARSLSQVLAMPVGLAVGMAIFYMACLLIGVDFETLATQGWLLPDRASATTANSLWTEFAKVDWWLVVSQWRSYISIAVISTLALLLAVTGLELSVRQRVDVDRELRAAGLANMTAGLAGSIPGYHDAPVTAMMSQPRLGLDQKSVLLGALLCLIIAIQGGDWLTLIPVPFLGGVFLWLGWRLWHQWLFNHGNYLQRNDWVAVAAIVLVTVNAGFIAGVLLGTGVGIALFLMDYSQVRAIKYIVNGREIRSNIDRPGPMEQFLYDEGRRVHIIKLQGYLFFARSHQVIVQLEPLFETMRNSGQHFVLIDFKGVAGIDSTAVMGFVQLRQMAEEVGGELVFSGLTEESKVDLDKSELSAERVKYLDDLNQGLAYCEDQLLIGHDDLRRDKVSASEVFAEIIDSLSEDINTKDYLSSVELKSGEVLIEAGDVAEGIYIVEQGSLIVSNKGIDGNEVKLRGLEPGSVFGEMAIYLGGVRTATVIAQSPSVVSKLSVEALARMEREHPQLAVGIHKMLARLLSTKLRQTNTLLGRLS